MSASMYGPRSETRLREEIVEFGRSIFGRGLTAGSSGNISARLEDGWLLTPTNASLGRLDPARISKIDWTGKLLSGDPPSKEAFLHRSMYEERAIRHPTAASMNDTVANATSRSGSLQPDWGPNAGPTEAK